MSLPLYASSNQSLVAPQVNYQVSPFEYFLGGQKAYFHATPKVACTSAKHMIADAFQVNVPDGKIHEMYPTIKFLPMWDREIRICIVRNPIDRFLSAFSNRVLHYEELDTKDLDIFISHFDYYFQKYETISHHFAPQVQFLGPSLQYFTHVYEISELEQFRRFLSLKTNKDIKLYKEQTGGSTIKPELTQTARDFIKEYYKQDFELLRTFGYYKDERIQ